MKSQAEQAVNDSVGLPLRQAAEVQINVLAYKAICGHQVIFVGFVLGMLENKWSYVLSALFKAKGADALLVYI